MKPANPATYIPYPLARRRFLALVSGGLLAAPLGAEAQQARKVPRIGYLDGGASSLFHESFRQGLREVGYVEGQNILVEYRWYEGRIDRARDLAAEFARQKVDVLVAVGPPGALAAKDVAGLVPVVFAAVTDPVRNGLVTSLGRPGGNMTGVALDPTPELSGKMVDLCKQLLPKLSRLAVLWHSSNPGTEQYLQEIYRVASTLKITVHSAPVSDAGKLEDAFAAIVAKRAEAIVVIPDVLTVMHHARIVQLVAQNRLPGVYEARQFVAAGGLLSYGPSLNDQVLRAAVYVDKILKGAKPADLPVEQPTKFELVINLKTAKALGLTIPQSLLLRADEVIHP